MDHSENNLIKNLPRFGIRHRQILLLFFLLTTALGMRVHLSVSVVAMTDPTASSNTDIPVYNWNNRSIILSSFFWGYISLQLFAAELGRRYGAKPFLLGAMTINSTAFALVPLLADKFGSYGVIGSRVIQGMCQGFVYPSISNLLGRWTHISERSKLGSLAVSGTPFGTILCLIIVGYISSTKLGWPFSFYLYSGVGYLWVVIFAIFGASSPGQCKYITKEEKAFIESSTKIQGDKKMPVPIRSIITCIPVWALLLAQSGQVWGYNTLLTEIPNYLNKVMNFDIKSNGLLSAAPYAACFLGSLFFGFICDYLINNKYLSRTKARKLFNGISGIGAGTSLITLSLLPANLRTLSVLMLISAVGIQSAATGGYTLNHIDLSPNFSGFLQAICNTIGSGISILAPVTVQLIVTEETDKSLWTIIFIIAGLTYIIPSVLFAFFASGERQKWDGADDELTVQKKMSEARAKKVSVWSVMSV